MASFVYMYNSRSRYSLVEIGLTANKLLLQTTIFSALAIALIVMLLFLGEFIGLYPIDFSQWLIVLALSVVPFVYIGLRKHLTHF